jgi:hypothetical protein
MIHAYANPPPATDWRGASDSLRPFRAADRRREPSPRALPWAGACCPVGAEAEGTGALAGGNEGTRRVLAQRRGGTENLSNLDWRAIPNVRLCATVPLCDASLPNLACLGGLGLSDVASRCAFYYDAMARLRNSGLAGIFLQCRFHSLLTARTWFEYKPQPPIDIQSHPDPIEKTLCDFFLLLGTFFAFR